MKLKEFFNLGESDGPLGADGKQHSSMCVCKGKNYVEDQGTDTLPPLPRQNMGQIVQTLRKIPCPYGDLRVNNTKYTEPPDDGTGGWDF